MRIKRSVAAITAAMILALGLVGPVSASTHQSSNYTLDEENITFVASQKLYYIPYSDHFDVDWSDLYINVLTCCGSQGTKLHCAYCKFDRDSPWPFGGYLGDDNSPSTFQYENTPAWAQVYLGSTYGDYYWGNTYIQFNNRAVSVGGYCDNIDDGIFSEYAGVRLFYSPSIGWQETPYSS